jgi:uncharacterized protein (DUF1684 family)
MSSGPGFKFFFKMKYFFLLPLLTLPFLAFSQHHSSLKKEIKKHRKHYKKEFLKDTRSPLQKQDIKHLRFFDADPAYRLECEFERAEGAKPFEMATYSGITKPYIKYGILTFSIEGQAHQLAVYQSLRLMRIPTYKDHLFIPFKDATNGETTYGGGRYIDISLNDIKDKKLILDFNRAYNPWCAYSDGYNCPIPPRENHLSVSILAGEAAYAGKVKK